MIDLLDPQHAAALDAQDPLAAFRQEFVADDPALIYLDGNSLGRLPRRTRSLIQDTVGHQWGARLIRGWNEGLQLMRPGAKHRLFVPPELAYGERGGGSKIGPNSTLVFEIELLSVQAAE